ncbi:hypothetical protein Trydic_g7167 [Trypoxylus dichotomus]
MAAGPVLGGQGRGASFGGLFLPPEAGIHGLTLPSSPHATDDDDEISLPDAVPTRSSVTSNFSRFKISQRCTIGIGKGLDCFPEELLSDVRRGANSTGASLFSNSP